MERDRQVQQMIDAAIARGEALREARALYRAQRRQALAAILYGVVIMVLVIAAAGG